MSAVAELLVTKRFGDIDKEHVRKQTGSKYYVSTTSRVQVAESKVQVQDIPVPVIQVHCHTGLSRLLK